MVRSVSAESPSAHYTRAWADFAAAAAPTLRDFEAALREPHVAQQHRLQAILRANAATAFGRAYEFSTITTIEAYQARVPIVQWADIRADVDRIQAGQPHVLSAQQPLHFERSSGSGARHKDIPYTAGLLREFQSALVVWLAALWRDCPDVAGPAYWALSPQPRQSQLTPAGIPIGAAGDAAYLSGSAAERLLTSLIDTRAACAASNWRCETLRLLVAEADLRLLSIWSPTFALALLEELRDPARAGGCVDLISPALDVGRRRLLRQAVDRQNFALLWPTLQLISCWSDGPSAIYAEQLGMLFPGVPIVPKGLLATEGVVSFSFGLGADRPAAITSHFLEFVDDDGAARNVAELQAGARYRPLLTTSGGLYRYRLGDIVEVTGYCEATPCLSFVGREDHRSDLVGEKLDTAVVTEAFTAAGINGPAVLVPDATARPPHYRLIVEDAAEYSVQRLEQALRRVHHYALARDNGQLDPISGVRVASLSGLLHAAWQDSGRRAGDTKAAALIVAADYAAALCRRLATQRSRT